MFRWEKKGKPHDSINVAGILRAIADSIDATNRPKIPRDDQAAIAAPEWKTNNNTAGKDGVAIKALTLNLY